MTELHYVTKLKKKKNLKFLIFECNSNPHISLHIQKFIIPECIHHENISMNFNLIYILLIKVPSLRNISSMCVTVKEPYLPEEKQFQEKCGKTQLG